MPDMLARMHDNVTYRVILARDNRRVSRLRTLPPESGATFHVKRATRTRLERSILRLIHIHRLDVDNVASIVLPLTSAIVGEAHDRNVVGD